LWKKNSEFSMDTKTNQTIENCKIIDGFQNSKKCKLFPRSWLITGFVTRLPRQVSLVEQELLTLPEHRSLPPVFSGVRVTRSLVLYFVDRCLSIKYHISSFKHCEKNVLNFPWIPKWIKLLKTAKSLMDFKTVKNANYF
jgi:hypothetical protein